MKTRTKTATAMKIIAAVLLLASAATLFLPWAELSITAEGETFSGGKILDKVAAAQDMTREECLQAMEDYVEELCRIAWVSGLDFDTKEIVGFVKKAVKGAWSPLTLSNMLGTMKNVAAEAAEEMSLLPQIGIEEDAVAAIQAAPAKLGTARILLLVLWILALAGAALALLCALTDHKLGILPYLILALLLLGLFAYGILSCNNSMNDTLRSFELGIPDDAIKLRVGLGAILCPVLAFLAFVAMLLPIGARETAASPVRSAAGGWKCPQCGAVRPADQRFCLNCGAKRPEAAGSAPKPAGGWKCPTCGAMLKADQHFCLYCGTKQPEKAAPASIPARPAEPKGWTCPTCGAKLKTSQNFCPRCGAKQPEQAAPVPTRAAAPAGWTCPTCGASLKGSQKFCPRCGTKRPGQEAPAPAPASIPARPAEPKGWTCPLCGAKLREDQRFCPRCGTRKPAPEAAPAVVPAQQAAPKPAPEADPVPTEKAAPVPAPTPEPVPEPIPEPVPKPIPEPASVLIPEPTLEPIPEPVCDPSTCVSCGATLGEGMIFCPRCGFRVGAELPKASPKPPVEAAHPAPEEEKPAAAQSISAPTVVLTPEMLQNMTNRPFPEPGDGDR